jgi:hypothetical protein
MVTFRITGPVKVWVPLVHHALAIRRDVMGLIVVAVIQPVFMMVIAITIVIVPTVMMVPCMMVPVMVVPIFS